MSLALVPGQTAQTVTPSGAPATVNGVLQPPPDIKSIVDKTAQFVARNGPEFEQRILCVMLNPQSCPQPQTPSPHPTAYPPPPRAALNTQSAVGFTAAAPAPTLSTHNLERRRHAVAKATPTTMCTRK